MPKFSLQSFYNFFAEIVDISIFSVILSQKMHIYFFNYLKQFVRVFWGKEDFLMKLVIFFLRKVKVAFLFFFPVISLQISHSIDIIYAYFSTKFGGGCIPISRLAEYETALAINFRCLKLPLFSWFCFFSHNSLICNFCDVLIKKISPNL